MLCHDKHQQLNSHLPTSHSKQTSKHCWLVEEPLLVQLHWVCRKRNYPIAITVGMSEIFMETFHNTLREKRWLWVIVSNFLLELVNLKLSQKIKMWDLSRGKYHVHTTYLGHVTQINKIKNIVCHTCLGISIINTFCCVMTK